MTTMCKQDGFTIVEIMISTLVFSLVLLVITIGVISFSNSYYKGITQSNTQNTARAISENVSDAIQFSGSSVTSPIGTTGSGSSVGFCIGDQRYSYLLGWQLVDGTVSAARHQTNHALVQDSSGDCSGKSAQNMQSPTAPIGTELLSPHMRLAKLSVTELGSSSLYTVDVRVVYGDDDLLCAQSVTNSCKTSGSTNGATATDAQCKDFVGSQFCAVSELDTTVQRRLQ